MPRPQRVAAKNRKCLISPMQNGAFSPSSSLPLLFNSNPLAIASVAVTSMRSRGHHPPHLPPPKSTPMISTQNSPRNYIRNSHVSTAILSPQPLNLPSRHPSATSVLLPEKKTMKMSKFKMHTQKHSTLLNSGYFRNMAGRGSSMVVGW